MIDDIKAWLEFRKTKALEKKVLALMQDPKSDCARIVYERAQRIAMGMVMTWLDNNRITHCKYCPNSKPLRNTDKGYMCEEHFKQFEKYNEEKVAKEKLAVAS